MLFTGRAGTQQTKAKPLNRHMHWGDLGQDAVAPHILLIFSSAWWLISCTQIMAVSCAAALWLRIAWGHQATKGRDS